MLDTVTPEPLLSKNDRRGGGDDLELVTLVTNVKKIMSTIEEKCAIYVLVV